MLTAFDTAPTVTSVIMNDGVTISVTEAEDLEVPSEDNIFNLVDNYPQPLFVAHDTLAGDHIMKLMKGGYVALQYSDGTAVLYQIRGYLNLKFDSSAERQYVDDGCIYFQTCHGDGIRAIVACH
jgi:hypothetical protein